MKVFCGVESVVFGAQQGLNEGEAVTNGELMAQARQRGVDVGLAGVVRRRSGEAVALEFGPPFRELRAVICDETVFFLTADLAEQFFVKLTRALERGGVRPP